MKGRPPKSKAKHKADRTYRKDRHEQAPADVIRALPKPPSWLTKAGAAKWKETGMLLVKAGILTAMDLDVLASYAQAWTTWREAIAAVEEHGQFVDSMNGPKKHPAMQIAETAHKTILALQERLGLLPLARQRIRVDAGGEEKDELDEFNKSS